MSDPTPTPANPEQRTTPEASLPPLQQPSAGFILQLFIIPGLIVLVIILIWLAFHWLAHMGGNPAELIHQMRQNKANSWQLAYNFSAELQQNESYRSDPELAATVADFLDDLLDQPLPAASERSFIGGDARSGEIARRGFLCKALGEFTVPEAALPVLIRAASKHADEDELRVRLAALEAIALLAENSRKQQPLLNEQLLPLLLATSENADRKISTRGAVALAALGGDRATMRLVEMLDEPHHVDVHYNAATGLARLGNAGGLETLEEMLDPSEQRALGDEPNENTRNVKRTRILLNALRASRLLAERNSEADLAALQLAVERLLVTEISTQIAMEGNATLRQLQQRNHP